MNKLIIGSVALLIVAASVFPWRIENGTTAKAAIAQITDLGDLSAYKQHRVEQKNVPGPANNSETNVLNIASGSGIVNYLWIANRPNGGYPQFDEPIRIYTNGSSTPDIDTDLGLFFGYAAGSEFAIPTNISTTHWSAKNGGTAHLDRYGGSMNLPIPFSNGIRIAIGNTNNTPVSSLFSQVDYRLTSDNPNMSVPPYKLLVTGNKWQGGRATVGATSDATLATIPSGNPGVIVGQSMAGVGSDYSYLERQIAIYIDGETSPSVESSGAEDWFSGSDYFFSGQSPFQSTWAMGLGANQTNNEFSALADFLSMNGGYAFNSSATIKWLTHPATDTSASYGTAIWYYRHV